MGGMPARERFARKSGGRQWLLQECAEITRSLRRRHCAAPQHP